MDTNEFASKVAFVTGAGSGIGRATARAFAARGARVACVDVAEDEGQRTSYEINEAGGSSIYLRADVSRDADVRRAVDETLTAYGRIDVAFNNAGIEGVSASTAECTEGNWDRVLDVNLKGVWLGMKYQLRHMLARGQGSIINCSSVAGLVGFVGLPAYVASKHAILGLTKTAALEYARRGIRVNAICPGVIETPMIARFAHGEAQILQQLASGEPVGRLGRPDEVANAVLWLASDASSFVTGQALAVDGGWVAQ